MNHISLAVVASALLMTLPRTASCQDAAFPDTPAGRRAAALLRTIRHADSADSIRQFFAAQVAPDFRNAFPMTEHVAQFRRMHDALRGATIGEVRARGDYEVTLEALTASGSTLQLLVQVEAAPPNRLLGIQVSAASGEAPGPPRPHGDTRVPDSERLVVLLSHYVDSLAQADAFSGVVLLARESDVLFERAYGLADRARRIANGVDTRFNLGSINKAFTAVAIQQLARSGNLDLDAPLGTYLPDYPNADARRSVTARQLLEHRSGIGGDIFHAPAGQSIDDVRSIDDYLRLFATEPLRFAPGQREEYSNAGYIVLGAIIERLTGVTYYDYVRDYIFEPLGMTHTASDPKDALRPNTAVGYMKDRAADSAPGVWRPNTLTLPGRGSSAGGGYSTAEDLLHFVRAAKAQRLPGMGGGIGIAGGAPGINGDVEADLPGGYDLIVLANLDPPAAERVAERAGEWLRSR